MMDRRRFIAAAAAGLGAASRRARAQPVAPRRIGFLGNGSPTLGAGSTEAFHRSLRELGWVEGRNIGFEYRWAEGNPDRLAALAGELVRSKVDVIVVSGPPAIGAARNATSTIPIVFVVLVDPVGEGFAQSLARPGGNLTGVASQYELLITKQLQLLKEAVPGLSRVALLRRPESAQSILAAAQAAARGLGLTALTLTVTPADEFEGAFANARRERVGAVHVLPSPYLSTQRVPLIAAAARHRLPACYELRSYVQDGGLMSYGPNIDEMFRRAATYVDRILKGARPGELSIERPARFELVINRKTAAALGLAIPASLLQRADELIA